MTLAKAPFLVGLLLLSVGLAGCVVDEPGDDEPPTADLALPERPRMPPVSRG